MLKLLKDLPENVLGVSAEGEVSGTDYETILIPAVEEKLRTNKRVNLLYHLGSDFTGFTMAAMLDDSIIGMKHLFSWNKIAIVSDHNIINISAKFFGYMMPCEVHVYKNEELEKAKEWITKI